MRPLPFDLKLIPFISRLSLKPLVGWSIWRLLFLPDTILYFLSLLFLFLRIFEYVGALSYHNFIILHFILSLLSLVFKSGIWHILGGLNGCSIIHLMLILNITGCSQRLFAHLDLGFRRLLDYLFALALLQINFHVFVRFSLRIPALLEN